MTRNKFLIPIAALMLVMGAMFFTVPAQAADAPILEAIAENLTVDAVWLVGDTLHIEVTDKLTGINQTLQLPLDEYAGNSEYVSVQAVDRNGGKSNTIQFKNPFYVPGADPADTAQTPTPSQSGIPGGVNPARPFTPDGTGTVVDNVTDGDGKEFFSIQTEDGNVFYLIVDRQRQSDNVYLLNAVTEDDLKSLAKPGDGTSQSGIPSQNPTGQNPPPPTTTEPPTPEPPAPANNGMNSGTVIFIVVAAIAVGGAGYYFKILRPKKQAGAGDADDYDEDDGSDYDDGDYDDPGEEGDEE